MFCRYLGQSLGAAIFGAIFNAALTGKLRGAPALIFAGAVLIMPGRFSTTAGEERVHGPRAVNPGAENAVTGPR
jgi:hypothetical protein